MATSDSTGMEEQQSALGKHTREAATPEEMPTEDSPPQKQRRTRKGLKQRRLTEEARLHFTEDALSEGVSRACAKYGVPLSTGYDLMKRWNPSKGTVSLTRSTPGPQAGKARKMTPD